MRRIQRDENGDYTLEFDLGSHMYQGRFDGKELLLKTFDDRTKMNVEIVARQFCDTETRWKEFYKLFAKVCADQLRNRPNH